MNSAKRLIDITESLKTTSNYFETIRRLFKLDDKYDQLMIYKYFLNDVRNIKNILIEREKYKDVYQKKLTHISNFISPNFKDHTLPIYLNLLEDLEMIESFLDDEVNYHEDIEKLRISLNGIEKSNTILDGIINDIDELVRYYGYFGANILEDKSNSIISKSFINKDEIKALAIKHSEHVKIIVKFFAFYQKTKNTYNDIKVLASDIAMHLSNKAIDEAEIITEQE